MRVNLSRRGDYAIRATLDLARHWDQGPRKAREIAATMDIPSRYLQQILADLVSAGLLDAKAGPAGGYRLGRHPESITLLEVVENAVGSLSLDRCILRGGPCDWVDTCPIHDGWAGAQQAFVDHLASVNFGDLAEIDRAIQQGRYEPAVPVHADTTPRRGIRDT